MTSGYHRIATAALACAIMAAPATAQVGKEVEKVGNTAQNIVEKPLKDLNVSKEKIPPQLESIMQRPYDLTGLKTCADFASAIKKLDAVLGPDVDAVKQAKGETASEMVLGAAESAAGGLIPGTGIIRKVSGAEAAEKKAKAAVFAGSLRRAYLKGSANAKGCKV